MTAFFVYSLYFHYLHSWLCAKIIPMQLQEWLTHAAANYPILVYGFIIIVSFFEGPILALFCGVLYRLDAVYIVPVYFSLMSGDLIGDCIWYYLGHHFGERFVERFGHYFSINTKNIKAVSKIFHGHKDTILLVSKLTMGLGFAVVTLFTAGMVKIPFRRYITLNILGQFVWTALLLTIGYTFGQLLVTFNNIIARISIFGVLLIFIIALFGFGKYMKNRMSDREVE